MDQGGNSVANKTKQMLELRRDDKSNAITTVNLVVEDLMIDMNGIVLMNCIGVSSLPKSVKGCKQSQTITQTMYLTLKDIECWVTGGRLQ